MSKKTLKFSDMVVNEKEFYASKQVIPLDSVNTNNIVASYRIKHDDDNFMFLSCHVRSYHVMYVLIMLRSQFG